MQKSPAYMPVIKAAQYLANISADQDLKSELCNVVSSFFAVDVVAVADKNLDGKVMLHHCGKDNVCGNGILLQQIVREHVLDVMDTGLFKEAELMGPPSITLFFIPIEVEKKVEFVLIIGHRQINPGEIKDLLNEYLAVAGLAGNIQSRIMHEQESARRKSNGKFRLLFDSARDPILLLDEVGLIHECNEAFIHMLGAQSKELVHLNRLSHFAPKYQPDGQVSSAKEVQLLNELMETGDAQCEWVVKRPDGTEIIVDAKLSAILIDGTKVQLVHCRDITERKRIEEQLKDLNAELEKKMCELQDINAALEEEISERQILQDKYKDALVELSAIFENTADAIYTFDIDGRLIQANKRYEQIFGWPVAEILGKRLPSFSRDNMHHAKYLIDAVISGGIVKDFETTRVRKDGSRVEVSISLAPVFDASGQVKALTAIARDITEKNKLKETAEKERKRHEEQLQQYAAELTETNKELKSFANMVAHDFRAPMVNLKGFSQELSHALAELKKIIYAEELQLPKQAQQKMEELMDRDVPEALKFIHASVDRLDRMVAALLKLARSGRREMIYKEVDMDELVNILLQSFYHQIDKKDIQMETKPLPQIETDHLAMEQIISNLLDNAIKYLKPDRPGKICIDYADNGNEYIFSVQDNGRGIDPADREKIFEIFRRAGTQDVPGEGMGLATVRTLIRQLCGRVWCESELGVGTTIKFTVPKRPCRAKIMDN